MIDYSKRYKNYSVFVPAVSHCYARLEHLGSSKREVPIPRKFLDFLDPNNPLYYIPCALFSAGQAARTQNDANKIEPMFDPSLRQNPIVIGDSGGYQIQTNMIKLEGDKTREMLLRYLERNFDISMTLDFPTGGINRGNMTTHMERFEREGVDFGAYCKSLGLDAECYQNKLFAACLHGSVENNTYFSKHRQKDATRFLNVLQGRNEEECDIWFNAVKHFEFEGFAFGGPYKENLSLTLRRLIHMRDEHLVKDWLHILGIGRLKCGPIYSTIQQCLRDINPKTVLSYDVSSPFMQTSRGLCSYGYDLNNKNWVLKASKMPDQQSYVSGLKSLTLNELMHQFWVKNGSKGTFFATEIGKLLTVQDLCPYDQAHSWDLVSYVLIMNHNLQMHLEAIFAAQDLYASDNAKLIPHGMRVLKQLIPEIFKSESPIAMIKRHRAELSYLANNGEALNGIQQMGGFALPPPSKPVKAVAVKPVYTQVEGLFQ